MDTLPLELIEKISSFLSQTDLKATLLLSRKFQYAAERHSGAFSDAELTPDLATTQKFLSTYNSHRFRYLRSVSFSTSVPGIRSEHETDENPDQPCRDTENERQVINEEFTNQIKMLFRTLIMVENHVYAEHGLGNIHLNVYTPIRYLCDSECYHRKFTSWRVRLLSPSTLPTLSSVRALTLGVPGGGISIPEEGGFFWCHIDYRVLLDMGRQCPNLDTLNCHLGGIEWRGSFLSQAMNESCQDWAGPRRNSRHDFAKAMDGIKKALPLLRHVQLDFLYPYHWPETFDHRLPLPDLVKPALSDPFSSSLRALSHQLRTMDIRVVADETLFWPVVGSCEECIWPNMQSINIMFCNAHPSGSWYFGGLSNGTKGYEVTSQHYPPLEQTDRDRANDEDEETQYVMWGSGDAFSMRFTRVFPQECLLPFLEAFTRAAARMPVLRQYALWTPVTLDVFQLKEEFPGLDPKRFSRNATEGSCPELAWGIAYKNPKAYHVLDTWTAAYDTSIRNIWWKVGSWRPESSLHQLFQSIGQEQHGSRVDEHWGAMDDHEESLDSREWFEQWTPSDT